MASLKNLKQSVSIKATPKEVYDAFMDSKMHSKFTRASSKLSKKVGGKFSVWNGYATGENLVLIPEKKIIQTWRASDWPSGHYSKISLALQKTSKGTKLNFEQKGIPPGFFFEIKQGWIDYYWKPLKEMLELKVNSSKPAGKPKSK
jgi:activator of HSP90 ATPase